MAEKHTSTGHNPVDRLRQYLHPNGRTTYIANSPGEAEALRRKLSREHKDGEFDLLIRGTPEHLDTIKEIHAHHESKRKNLRQEHTDLYAQFEMVHAELAALSFELASLTTKGVALDANFSRYGYSARIRMIDQQALMSVGKDHPANNFKGTHDVESTSNSTLDGQANQDWEAEKRRGQTMRFSKKPVIRQYWHKGLIWRASDKEEVASFELFVDLLYVGIIAISGDQAARDPTGSALLHFCITFILSWKLWSDLTLIISWFETDDIIQRFFILFFCACLIGYTTNITNAFTSTYTELVAFYLTQRLLQAAYFTLISFILPTIRGMLIATTIAIIVPAVLWIISIQLEGSGRLVLIWIALALDLWGSGILVAIKTVTMKLKTGFFAKLGQYFEFFPAVNIEHKTERTNAFVTLVFGYSVVALLYQNQASFGINAFFGKAVLGLSQAFAFNMIYFEIDNFNIYVHAIRRHMVSYLFWMTLHLPFIMSFILAAASLSKLVVANDCPNANPDTLADSSRLESNNEISPGLRWFYCGGLGLALACMGAIAITHDHKEVEGQRVLKRHRLAFRFVIAIILLCLPIAKTLNSLQLVSITTGMVFSILMVDIYGSSCVRERFWMGHSTCSYSTDCRLRKRDIQLAIESGKALNLDDIASRGIGEKGLFDFS